MAITHVNAVRNSLAGVIRSAVDAGSANPSGQLIFLTAGEDTVATLPFSNPAFGSPEDGVITAASITDDTNSVGGTVAAFIFVDRDGDEVLRGTVTGVGGGGDIELTSTSIGAGDTISVSSMTYEASV